MLGCAAASPVARDVRMLPERRGAWRAAWRVHLSWAWDRDRVGGFEKVSFGLDGRISEVVANFGRGYRIRTTLSSF